MFIVIEYCTVHVTNWILNELRNALVNGDDFIMMYDETNTDTFLYVHMKKLHHYWELIWPALLIVT